MVPDAFRQYRATLAGAAVARRFLQGIFLVCLTSSVLLAAQALVVVACQEPIALQVGKTWEVGTNGLSIRILWSKIPGQSLAWDIVDIGWRFDVTNYDVLVYLSVIPLLVFCICMAWLARRWMRRLGGWPRSPDLAD
jgi:hypothetical protein